MTKHVKAVTPASSAGKATSGSARHRPAADPESLDQLRGDCARMAPHWNSGRQAGPPPGRAADLHGIKVSASSAALVDGMSEYGD
ncbi:MULTISPECIES: hypothetical protein [unclassified Streptomyces]|uniref:hypothetical protein n=1 Tax=unclassified Streptomyces TaxID=2593676 RepID=UPI00380672F0